MSDFHFSPRPNRAGEIAWSPWSAEAFERAKREDKPVLLSISAVWCHWCHVMDETSYSDENVIETINEHFVPVRVDNDERPDVNARYNMGGWPTTAFLAPDGTTITGATYLPPSQMQRALGEIARFYAEKKDEIAERTTEMRTRTRTYEPAKRDELQITMIERIVKEVSDGYDSEYGGFGTEPKFPQTEVLEMLLSEWRITGDPHLYEMVARTMHEMSLGGMYDHIEGGFFRYSTTRDWSIPHFEKMTEDHAGLLRVLSQLLLWSPTADTHATLISAIQYVRAILRDPKTGLFAGSQDADETYYTLPLEERREHGEPFVDRRSYSNWSAALAGAFAWAATALDDDAVASEAMMALDTLHERVRDDDGLLNHVLAPGEAPRIRGLLTDQVAYFRALLDVHEQSGEPRFLERAIVIADKIIDRFSADDGGFYDHSNTEATLGRLEVPDRPIIDNGLCADSLLRLAAATGNDRYRTFAEAALALYAHTYANAGSFASTYVRALRRYLSPEPTVKVLGTARSTAAFRETARRLPSPLVTIRTLRPEDGPAAGLPAEPHPAAYVCVGTVCAAPVRDAAELRAAYDTVA